MKQIAIISAVLAVLATATMGCLYLFEVMSFDAAMTGLMKIVGAIVLLGGCSALIALLLRANKEPPA